MIWKQYFKKIKQEKISKKKKKKKERNQNQEQSQERELRVASWGQM